MKNKLIIIGAGGHGKVAAETALQSGKWDIAGFCDDQLAAGTIIFEDLKVIGSLAQIGNFKFDNFFVAIGNNMTRKEIFVKLCKDHQPATLIHPFTQISSHTLIGSGSIILPGAVVSFGVKIGANCIIGSNAHIDHESIVGAHCHIRNGTTIGSNCNIAEGYTTETGFAIQPFSKL